MSLLGVWPVGWSTIKTTFYHFSPHFPVASIMMIMMLTPITILVLVIILTEVKTFFPKHSRNGTNSPGHVTDYLLTKYMWSHPFVNKTDKTILQWRANMISHDI